MSTTIDAADGGSATVFCGPDREGIRLVGLQVDRYGGQGSVYLTPDEARKVANAILARFAPALPCLREYLDCASCAGHAL